MINLISIPFVLFFAWAKGRGLIRWAVMAFLFGFWSLLPLFMVKTQAIKIYKVPKPIKEFVTARSFKKRLKNIKYPADLQKEI